ncbi:MAG TPA: YciI family protein [Marmoricola sp.]|nr:YciI family protein [Marmoricola sp.]
MPRYMLLQNYAPAQNCDVPMEQWEPAEVNAHIEFQHELNALLTESGELADAQGLAWPGDAKFVVAGAGAPVITDGPFPESKELVAGYRIVEVDNLDRALEIAALASAAPGPGGVAMGVPVEVREIMGAPEPR